MDGVRGEFLRPPHVTTPAAVKLKINLKVFNLSDFATAALLRRIEGVQKRSIPGHFLRNGV